MFEDVNQQNNNPQTPPPLEGNTGKPANDNPAPPGLPTEPVQDKSEVPKSPLTPKQPQPSASSPMEVEDMLGESDNSPAVVNTSGFSQAQKPAALAAPLMPGDKPKMQSPLTPASPPPIPPEELTFANEDVGGKKKMLLIGIGIIVVLLVAIGGYLAYQKFFVNVDSNLLSPNEENTPTLVEEVERVDEEQAEVIKIEEEELTPDTDGDGLTNEEEATYNTDPLMADSDKDGLFDREEIITWKTDPLNPDSDGDSYLDGDEVKQGYDPLGSGKLDYYPFLD